MHKTHFTDPAICSDGRCDLRGLPCLRALDLVRQMARASVPLEHALVEAFSLQTHVDVAGCLRPRRLAVSVAAGCVAVSHEGEPLASADLQFVSMERRRFEGSAPFAAVAWRAH